MIGYAVYDPTDQSICYESLAITPDTTGIDHEEIKERAILAFCAQVHIDPRQWTTLQTEGYRVVRVEGVLNFMHPPRQVRPDAPNYYTSLDPTENPLCDPLIYYYERRAPTPGQMDFAEEITRMALKGETNPTKLAWALGVISAAYNAPLDLIRAFTIHPTNLSPLDPERKELYVKCAIVHNWCNLVEGLRPAVTLFNPKMLERE
jgi:hypothetical protein